MEKKLADIRLHVSDKLKHDIQDAAMHDDRSVGDYIRLVLEDHLYGVQRKWPRCNGEGADRDD